MFASIQWAPDEMGAAGGMPAAPPQVGTGAAPSTGTPPSPSLEGVGDDEEYADEYAEGDQPEEPAPEAEAPPPAPAAPTTALGPLIPADSPHAGMPVTVVDQLSQAATSLVQVRDYITQRAPQVVAQRQALEQVLRGMNYELLAEEQKPQAYQMYQQWQALAMKEKDLGQKWQEFQQAVPMLQHTYDLEHRRAMLNAVGEPMAYQLLAERAKRRSGDPDFPVSDLITMLQGVHPDQLESVATKFEGLWRKWSGQTRRSRRVDDMGPSGGGGESRARQSGRNLIRSALQDELRRNPAR